jgi:hypothetical protein
VKIRTMLVSLAVAVAAVLPLAGVASAQTGDRDCPDFATQAEAQEALDSQAGDPERLDANDNGIACESEFADSTPTTTAKPTTTPTSTPAPAGQVRVVPRGAVDTGDGSGGDTGAWQLLLVGAITAGAVTVVRRRVSHQR